MPFKIILSMYRSYPKFHLSLLLWAHSWVDKIKIYISGSDTLVSHTCPWFDPWLLLKLKYYSWTNSQTEQIKRKKERMNEWMKGRRKRRERCGGFWGSLRINPSAIGFHEIMTKLPKRTTESFDFSFLKTFWPNPIISWVTTS